MTDSGLTYGCALCGRDFDNELECYTHVGKCRTRNDLTVGLVGFFGSVLILIAVAVLIASLTR